jgi:hypothetical protein
MTQLTLNLQGDLEATGEMKTSSSPVASRNYVNHSAPLEKEKAQMMNATCGAKCYEQFKKLNRDSSLLKMSLVSRILMADWYSSKCALTWKVKGTKYNRLLFQLVPRTLRTEETDAGLLLKTPCSADAYTENLTKKEQRFGNSGTLAQEVQTGFIYQRGMLPTPQATDYRDKSTSKSWESKGGVNFSLGNPQIRAMLPTPRVGGQEDYKTRNKRQGHQKAMTYLEANIQYQTGQTSRLNPRFVAEMMGFPPNWTELPFQNGETNQLRATATQ